MTRNSSIMEGVATFNTLLAIFGCLYVGSQHLLFLKTHFDTALGYEKNQQMRRFKLMLVWCRSPIIQSANHCSFYLLYRSTQRAIKFRQTQFSTASIRPATFRRFRINIIRLGVARTCRRTCHVHAATGLFD